MKSTKTQFHDCKLIYLMYIQPTTIIMNNDKSNNNKKYSCNNLKRFHAYTVMQFRFLQPFLFV